MGRVAGAGGRGQERAADGGAPDAEAGGAGGREAGNLLRGLRDLPHGSSHHRHPGADGEADVCDAQLRVPPELLRALRERPLPHCRCQLRHPHGEAQRLLPERQSQQDRDQGHPLPVLRLPGEGGHGHHGPQCPGDICGGGVLPMCDSQRLLEPAHGVHAELHGEPRSRPPLCVWHQARQHLQPLRHHGAVHGALQQDPQAAAGACGWDEVNGCPRSRFGMTASSFPWDQDTSPGAVLLLSLFPPVSEQRV